LELPFTDDNMFQLQLTESPFYDATLQKNENENLHAQLRSTTLASREMHTANHYLRV
jgi:hypothetical protein